jgi:cation transport regulator ChaB
VASAIRAQLTAEQQAVYDEAIANAGRVYAEGLARQASRSPREAAKAALGSGATQEEISAWIATYRQLTASEADR